MEITELDAFMPSRVNARQGADGDGGNAETLRVLFGRIEKPPGMARTPAIQTPSASPGSSPASTTSPAPGSSRATGTAHAPVGQAEVQATRSKAAAPAATPAPATPGVRSWQSSPRRLSGNTAVSGSSSSGASGKAPDATIRDPPQIQPVTPASARLIEKPVVPSHLHIGRNESTPGRSPSATMLQRNVFGQAPFPAKRSGSPLVPTHAKVPRVGHKGDLDDLGER